MFFFTLPYQGHRGAENNYGNDNIIHFYTVMWSMSRKLRKTAIQIIVNGTMLALYYFKKPTENR